MRLEKLDMVGKIIFETKVEFSEINFLRSTNKGLGKRLRLSEITGIHGFSARTVAHAVVAFCLYGTVFKNASMLPKFPSGPGNG